MGLEIKPRAKCEFDLISLGEVMLRLDPGDKRIHTTRLFHVWEGGGEYNVARGLRRCFGLKTAVVTSLVDNPVGRLLEDLMLQGGVDLSMIRWIPFDGIGRTARNGLNFTERGFGLRGALGCSDRGHSAASLMKPGDIDWETIFKGRGARWFHTGGIFAALSRTAPDVALEAIGAAKKHKTVVSYDLNFRPSLWQAVGGKDRAREVNREIARHVDVMIGNEEDFTACLGFEVEGVDPEFSSLDVSGFRKMIEKVVSEFPNIRALATTLRKVTSATRNDWGAVGWVEGKFYEAVRRTDVEIFDRVGGGDSFASGFIYGLMELEDPQGAIDFGAAHGVLAMTTPGDTSMALLKEIAALVKGKSARVKR